MLAKMKKWAKQLKNQLMILYYSCKNPTCPWIAKIFTAFVVAYAFSPIDLVPDFIPILGYLDDVILLPLGIFIALKLVPEHIIEEAKSQIAASEQNKKPRNLLMGAIIIFVWIAIFSYLTYLFLKIL